MITRTVARLQRRVLMPLSIGFLVSAGVYLCLGAWIVGAYLLFAWFCVGLVGQALHKDKSFAELSRGGLAAETNIKPDAPMSHEEAYLLGKALLATSWLCGITVGVLLFHHDCRWFVAVPSALLTGFLAPAVLILPLLLPNHAPSEHKSRQAPSVAVTTQSGSSRRTPSSKTVREAIADFLDLLAQAKVLSGEDRLVLGKKLDKERLADEKKGVALFAAYIALKSSQCPGWSRKGQEVFTRIAESITPWESDSEYMVAKMREEWINDRFRIYSLSLELVSNDPTPDRIKQEVGRGFAELCGSSSDKRLVRIGAATFQAAMDRAIDIVESSTLT